MIAVQPSRLDFRPAGRALIVLAVAITAATGLGWLASPETLRSTDLTIVLSLIAIALAVGPIISRYQQGTLDLADLGMWFAVTFSAHFGLGGLYVTSFGSRFLHLRPDGNNYLGINVGLGLAITAISCFWVGYHRPEGASIGREISMPRHGWEPGRIRRIALMSIAFGWAFRLLLMQLTAGSILAWFSASKDKILLEFDGLTYVAALSVPAYVGVLALFIGARKTGDRSLWILLGAFLPIELAFRMIGGSRNQFVFMLFQLLIAWYMTSARSPKVNLSALRAALVLVVVLIVTFPITTGARVYGLTKFTQLFEDSPEFLTPKGFLWFIGDRFHGLESLSLIAQEVPDHESYTYFQDTANVAIAWIPRAVWPDKPHLSVGQKFEQEMVPPGLYGEGAAVAVTMPGQMFWAWGLGAVIGGMFAIGILWRGLNQFLVAPRGNASCALVVSAIFPTFLMAVEQELSYLLTFHLFTFVIALFIAKRLGQPHLRAAQ